MSGCSVCVYDLYEESVEAYKQSLSTIRASLDKLNIPESQWPPDIQRGPPSNASENTPKKSVVLSAFEEMEQRLREKHSLGSGKPEVMGSGGPS